MPLADDHNTVLAVKFHSFNVQWQNYGPCSRTMSHGFGCASSVAVYASAWSAVTA